MCQCKTCPPLFSIIPTYAHMLGAAGYHTVLAGRMHFMGPDQRHGFMERLVGDVTSYTHWKGGIKTIPGWVTWAYITSSTPWSTGKGEE